ncbi:MAG: DUF465 domain-containing protein [Acidobacteriota bacterium]|nr:DUF465 domain-containing protein [Acidobacteriota bacterium]
MIADAPELKELLESDPEFHQLYTTHHALEDRLHELSGKHYLTGQEEVEESTLKKRKLHVKDRMEEILRQYRGHAGLEPQPQG